jgi:predicted ATPase
LDVLTLASVVGRDFRLDLLRHLSGLSSDALLDVLDEAARERLVAPIAGSAQRLRFAHALIRETL